MPTALALAASREGSEVVARLFGRPITRAELSAPVAFQIYQHEVAIHGLLEREAERLADERVLAEEAARRGTTPAALLAEVEAGAAPVSDAEVDRQLAEHGSTVGTHEEARPRIRHYLEERRKIELRLALLTRLRREAGYAWLLEPPAAPRTALDIEGAPVRGPESAPVTIVHFASFGSHESAESAQKLARVIAELGPGVRWVHRNFPREGDLAGLRGAEAGFAAEDAGRFWELHDALFERDGRIDEAALREALDQVGIPHERVSDAEGGALVGRVRRDVEAGQRAGVLREPTLFVNGRYWSGIRPYEELRALVREELGAARGKQAGRARSGVTRSPARSEPQASGAGAGAQGSE